MAMKTRKSKQQMSSGEFFIIVFLILVIIVVACVRYFSATNDGQTLSNSLETEKYKQLMLRAQQLKDKYKSLTGSETLPAEMSTLNTWSNLKSTLPTTMVAADTVLIGGSSENVVFGMAQDTDSKNLAVFCKSLRSVSTADAIIFANAPVPVRHKQIAKENRIKLVEFDVEELEVSLQKFHPSTLRWVLFHNYLEENKSLQTQYRRVWMIDVRDSYFQSDPFTFMRADEEVSVGGSGNGGGGGGGNMVTVFHAFQGVELITIGECGWNGGWVKDCFGEEMLRTVGRNHIICSGVSATSMAGAMKYIGLMNSLITSRDAPGLNYKAKFPACERNGVDQGVHNVLMHTNALSLASAADDVRIVVKTWSQRDSPVANMQARMMTIRPASGGGGGGGGGGSGISAQEVWNSKGERVAVVHQYDRYPDLQKYLFAKYVDWVNTNDFSSVWSDEPACSQFQYKENADLFKGKCDAKMHGGATSAATCCKHCTALIGCKAFTFAGGVCYLKSCTEQAGGNVAMQGAVSGFFKH